MYDLYAGNREHGRLRKAQKYGDKCFRCPEIYLRVLDRFYTGSRIHLKALKVFELIFTCISFFSKIPKYSTEIQIPIPNDPF